MSFGRKIVKIAVYGVGAVGGYFGARLAQAGCDVTFIARGESVDTLRNDGLRVESLAGDFVLNNVQVVSDPQALGPVDAVFVTVKAWQLDEVAQSLGPLLNEDSAVVPLLNGVEAAEVLVQAVGKAHVLGGLCGIVAERVAPGFIRHTGAAPHVTFGELDNVRSPRVLKLQAAFSKALGADAHIADDIQVALWQKFMLICPWSGVGAVTRSPAGVFRSHPATRALLIAACTEVATLARARGVGLPDDAVESIVAYFDTVPQGAIASMHRDIVEGRPSELQVQNGAVVRMGEAAGIDTPVNRFIASALSPLELRARGELSW
jgi:2-dehydropantoate 2-reductase